MGDVRLQRNSFFKTSSECSAGDLHCTSEKPSRVTAVEALEAPAISTVYLSVERSQQYGLLQQRANDASGINLLKTSGFFTYHQV
jgi:hypothetical protein